MSLYNDLVRHDFDKNITHEELKRIQNSAQDVVDNLVLGVSSIGNLMFWAAASEGYTETNAKADMRCIGAMLGDLGELIRALNDTAGNAAFTRLSKAQAPKKGATA